MDPLSAIRALGVLVRVDSRTALFRRGTPITRVFLIESGELALTCMSAEGRELVIRKLGPGNFVPLTGLIEHGCYTTDCSAVSSCDLLAIQPSSLLQEIRKDPELAYYFLQLAVRKLQKRTLEFEDNALLTVGARLCKWLIERAQQHGPLGTGSFVNLSDSERLIGLSLGGTSRETISRHLATLAKARIISREGRLIRVLDPARLQGVAEGLHPFPKGEGPAQSSFSEVA